MRRSALDVESLMTRRFAEGYIRNKPRTGYKRSGQLRRNRERESTPTLKCIDNQDDLSVTVQDGLVDDGPGWTCRISV